MAQHAVLSHPDIVSAGIGREKSAEGWSPRVKLVCFLASATACWAIVLAPFYLIG